MATAYVTYLGDPGKDPDHLRQVSGMEPWHVGETRAFTDEYAQSCGRGGDGAEFALFFTGVDNANMAKPRWAFSETDPTQPAKPEKPEKADKPEKATSAAKTENTTSKDTPSSAPAESPKE